jgi:hypothetical protein
MSESRLGAAVEAPGDAARETEETTSLGVRKRLPKKALDTGSELTTLWSEVQQILADSSKRLNRKAGTHGR